jgi:hypothetical protein
MDESILDERFEQLGVEISRLQQMVQSDGDRTREQVDGLQTEVSGLRIRVDNFHEQVKLVAEWHGVLMSHIVDIKNVVERLEAGQTSFVVRVSVVESRVIDADKTQKVMLAEVRRLAAKK